ncbi:MAG: acyl-CoA mutase large subunit family protein [Candidatus Rokuibacteriota bacterium]
METPLIDPKTAERLRATFARWQAHHFGSDDGRTTATGIPVKPLYGPADVAGLDYGRDVGFPGESPFTRGAYPTMYRRQAWTLRPLAGYGTPEDTNERLRYLLAQGATGLNITFDYPTLRGYDSDAPEARADAGLGGVAIDGLDDVARLFAGIPLERVSVSLVTCNPGLAAIAMPMYMAVARAAGVPLDRLAGTCQNDFLMECAVTTAPQPLAPAASFRLSCDTVEYCLRHLPRWHPISFVGYNLEEAGATTVQELGLVFAHARAVVRELQRRGIEPDQAAPRLSFFFSASNDFFEQVAKYRAARRIWHRMMREEFGAGDPRAWALRFHVQTSGVALTAQQPEVNIIRSAYHALAAVLGGAQSLHVSAYDEALGLPTEETITLALRTQQVLLHETNVTATIDPLAGSYYGERLTSDVEARVLDFLGNVEAQGDIVAATERGWVHAGLARSAYEHQMGVRDGRIKVVGVNCFVEPDRPRPVFTQPPAVARQAERLRRWRETRDGDAVARALDRLESVLRTGHNAFPAVLEAVETGATLGEVHRRFRETLGVWAMPLFGRQERGA